LETFAGIGGSISGVSALVLPWYQSNMLSLSRTALKSANWKNLGVDSSILRDMTVSELLRRHLAMFGNVNLATAEQIYAEDISMEFPYAPQHHTQRLDGRQAVINFVSRVGEFFRDFEIGDPVVHQTTDPSLAIAEYPGRAISNETGKEYRQNYISVITTRDGQIAHIKEYYNPVRVLVTTNEIEEPGS